MADILIKNGRIWDGERFFFADVLTQGDRIAAIGENLEPQTTNTFVFNATGMTVAPGLVDAHAHFSGPEPDRFGIDPAMSCIPFGVTAAADAGGAHADRHLAENLAVKNVTFVTVPIRADRPDFGSAEKKLALYGDLAIGLKVYFDTNSSDVQTVAPLRQICRYARERKLLVMVHCSNSPVPMAEILETLSPGDILTHAYHGGIHSAARDDFASMVAAKERGVVIDAGFAGHIHTDLAVFQAAVAKGALPHTISTDITRASAYMRGGRYGMTMCMTLARIAGMEEKDIFRCVTGNPAKALGKEGLWGCLTEGGPADIAVFSWESEGFCLTDRYGNHMESPTGYRCKLTVADGVILWRDE